MKDVNPSLIAVSHHVMGNCAAMCLDPSKRHHGWIFEYWHEDLGTGIEIEQMTPIARNMSEYLVIGFDIPGMALEGFYLGPTLYIDELYGPPDFAR